MKIFPRDMINEVIVTKNLGSEHLYLLVLQYCSFELLQILLQNREHRTDLFLVFSVQFRSILSTEDEILIWFIAKNIYFRYFIAEVA